MTMADPDAARPRAVTVAVLLTYLSAVLGLVGVVLILAHADRNADDFLRDHPDVSRTVALSGSYVLAGIGAVTSVLVVVAGRALHRGRRWGWIFLLVITGLGLFGVVNDRSLRGVLYFIPDLVLLACLLLPATREFLDAHARMSRRPETSPPWYADH